MLSNQSFALDGSVETLTDPLALEGIAGDSVRSPAGQPAHIDVNMDCVITSASGSFSYMDIYNYGATTDDLFGVDPLFTRVAVTDGLNPGSEIRVDGELIGRVADFSGPNLLSFNFTGLATAGRVQELLRSLTYVNTSPDAGLVAYRSIEVNIGGVDAEFAHADLTVVTAPDGAEVFTPGVDHLVGTAGDDVFTVAEFCITNGDEIDGGLGGDTLQLEAGASSQNYFELNRLTTFSGIETINGSSGDDALWLRSNQLADIVQLDGQTGTNNLWLAGSDINLEGRIVLNFAQVGLLDDNAVITLDNAETAKLVTGFAATNEKLVLTNGILTADERTALHAQGVDIISARETANGPVITTTHLPPVVTDLDGDHVTLSGSGPVILDSGLSAAITATDAIVSLSVSVGGQPDVGNLLGVDVTGSISLSGGLAANSVISVGGTVIGHFGYVDGSQMAIDFGALATPALIQMFLSALTYSHLDGIIAAPKEIGISLFDASFRQTTATVTVDPAAVVQPPVIAALDGDHVTLNGSLPVVLDAGLDAAITAGDAIASLAVSVGTADGGDLLGVDLTGAVSLGGGLAVGGVISVGGTAIGQFTAVGGSQLAIAFGATATLAQIQQFVSALTYSHADGIIAAAKQIGISLTDAGNRQTTATVTVDPAAVVQPPVIAALDGDHVTLNGQGPVVLDAGLDAAITAGDAIASLTVSVGTTDAGDQLGVDLTGAISLGGGLAVGSVISVGGAAIGKFGAVGGSQLSIIFDATATLAQIEQFVGALTYSHADGIIAAAKQIGISLTDAGNRQTTATVTVDPAAVVVPEPNVAPARIDMSASTVAELSAAGTFVASLKAVDANAGDMFTYTLLDDAGGRFVLNGNSLLVADGFKFDYEQVRSHAVTIRVTDSHGLFRDQSLSISVSDVMAETTAGSNGDDFFIGGAFNDRLGGGFGNDKLSGGAGKDVLTGGKGRDIFVFNTKLNKKTNVDKIVDFNVKDDTIHLAKSFFSKISKKGFLAKSAFWQGAASHDASDRLIYNKKTGALFYDPDGDGAKAAVQFATLSKNLKVGSGDFFLM